MIHTRVEAVDVDLAVKEQRNHRIVRMPVKRDTLRGDREHRILAA